MLEAINHLLRKDTLFWLFALGGSSVFVIQFILSLLGMDNHEESGDFKWLSKQALTGFIMMFGWVGLTCRKEFEFTNAASSLIAFGVGLLSILIIGSIFRVAKKLQSSGTVFKIDDAVGKNGVVYHRIPENGIGKISISLEDFTYEIDAVSLHHKELASFTQVHVIKKSDDTTVVVVPIK